MAKAWQKWGVVALVAGIGVYAWWAKAPSALPLAVAAVERGEVKVTLVNTRAGTIKSCQRAGLSLPAGGVVQTIAVQVGQTVAKDDLLLSLWRDDLLADAARVRAQQKMNQVTAMQRCAEAAVLSREAKRVGSLLAQKLASNTQADQAQSQADSSAYACQAAKLQAEVDAGSLALVQARLRDRELRAPFAGVVAEINSKLGEYMTPSPPGVSMPPVVDLIDDRCLYISAPIDEVDAARLRVGQVASVSLDAMPGQALAATVTRIAPYVKELEKQARTVEVEATLTVPPPPEQPLLIGYSADVEITVSTASDVLRIPATARLADGHVLVLRGERLVRVKPTFGSENWNWLEVSAGLAAGDQLAAQPNNLALDARYMVKAQGAGDE
ncbi:MAG: efflux RND transporter periplasmic adaptor subunit [Aeromonas sp.]